ncbi:hypothetical protein ACIGXM_01400 [Kitasatospora sp. NPDC052896]|uniref:hypothetical protein n=1 Tax=Kitasatospora sp. NPDC052896 TaxID=3364061 RepID=UPI0037C9F21D
MSGSHRSSAKRRRSAGPASAGRPGGAAVPGARAQSRGRRRRSRRRRGALTGTVAVLVAAAVGWFTVGPGNLTGGQAEALPRSTPDLPSSAAGDAAPAASPPPAARPSGDSAIPGLGASFLARIPADTSQVVLASGAGRDSSTTAVTLWSRTPDGRWSPGPTWAAHNGDAGWTADHTAGDLRSPIGVFTLSDAGGLKADPGSRLPYHQDSGFVATGTGFSGESLAGAFDYVVAIDYNRVTGTSPLDPREPQGTDKGGGIWLHVDHGGPTHACVSLAEPDMISLLRALDPAAHPVIAMGDAASLAV